MIETLVRWTEIRMKAENSEDALLKRLVDGDETAGRQHPEFYYDFSPMVFDLDDVARFNRSKDPEYTTIRFEDGESFIVKISYKTFVDLWVQQTGKAIYSILPDDFEPSEDKKNNSEDDLEI